MPRSRWTDPFHREEVEIEFEKPARGIGIIYASLAQTGIAIDNAPVYSLSGSTVESRRRGRHLYPGYSTGDTKKELATVGPPVPSNTPAKAIWVDATRQVEGDSLLAYEQEAKWPIEVVDATNL
jgi:hypothetical protein